MNDQHTSQEHPFLDSLSGPRRPRIALMGEFSAGKSTLANLMIGRDPLPMQVVATRLPPVWIRYGTDAPKVVDIEGRESACDLDAIGDLDPEEIAFIQLQYDVQVLEHCDIIDMPGISDPNMSSEVWARIVPALDGIVWCTPATQAWRQSEASAWESFDERVRRHSMLLLTRADMVLNDRDKQRILQRVLADRTAEFRQTLMISLIQAQTAVDDDMLWETSGADGFVHGFMAMVDAIAQELNLNGIAKPDPSGVSDADKIKPRRPVRKKISRQGSALDPNAPESFTPKFS